MPSWYLLIEKFSKTNIENLSPWDSILNWAILVSHVTKLNGATQQVAHMLLYRGSCLRIFFSANGVHLLIILNLDMREWLYGMRTICSEWREWERRKKKKKKGERCIKEEKNEIMSYTQYCSFGSHQVVTACWYHYKPQPP